MATTSSVVSLRVYDLRCDARTTTTRPMMRKVPKLLSGGGVRDDDDAMTDRLTRERERE